MSDYYDLGGVEGYQPPEGWQNSPDGRATLARALSRKLSALAVEFDNLPAPDALTEYKLKSEAGETIIACYRAGLIDSIPNLGRYVDWHTASDENDPVVGVDVQARRRRGPCNLFLDVVGGHMIVAQFNGDGTSTIVDPEPSDGILPAAGLVQRGDKAEACRFLADTIQGQSSNSNWSRPLSMRDIEFFYSGTNSSNPSQAVSRLAQQGRLVLDGSPGQRKRRVDLTKFDSSKWDEMR